jgi:site-specific DNA-methyltransferase (adenine-specific)
MNTNQTPPPSGLASPSCSVSSLVPFYDRDGITIYHGDNRKILPLLEDFDLLLTDPPYGLGEHGGACRTRGRPGYAKHENLGWDKEPPAEWVLKMCIEKADTAMVWGGNYFGLPPSMGWLYWRKLMGGDFSDGELAWTNRKAALKEFTKCPKGMDKDHPCQKPLELIQWCISLAGDVQTILDPWAGSGTTGHAAKNLGKRCVMIEMEERYCEIAALRLAQDVLQFSSDNAKDHG